MSASTLFPLLKRLVKRLGVRHAGRTAVAAVVTQLVVTVLNLPQGYWAVITAVIVMQANIGGSIRAAWARLLGTGVGAVMGIVAVHGGGSSWPALGMAVFATLMVCTAVPFLRESSRVGGITAVIVLLAGHGDVSALTLGLDRFFEIAVGIITALAVSLSFFPSRARKAVSFGLAKIFQDEAAFFSLVLEGLVRDVYNDRQAFALKDRIVRTLARCRDLRREANLEGRGGEAAAAQLLLLFRAEHLFEHILAMDHIASEWHGQGLQSQLTGELAGLRQSVGAVLSGLAAHLRGDGALPDLAELETSVTGAREKLSAMRRERAPAAYGLSEVMHFFSFMHGMLACAAETGEIVGRLRTLEQE
ncbi:MAG: aromatic acid exporter family protein [Desulfovibrio sp.]